MRRVPFVDKERDGLAAQQGASERDKAVGEDVTPRTADA